MNSRYRECKVSASDILHGSNKPSVVGINPSDTLGLRPDPLVCFRLDNIPHLIGEAFHDHGSVVETSQSLWMWSIGMWRGRRPAAPAPALSREADRPCRQVTHLLQNVHESWYKNLR